MKKTIKEYLEDISLCIDRIEKHVENISFTQYISNEDKMDII